jgi:glycosyltransferase involved in cell wall biosynthesis
VICADVASLPEVAGDAALLLPPTDVAAWADAWRTLWQTSARRDQLRRAGLAQAARFSWRRAAEQTLAIYRRFA